MKRDLVELEKYSDKWLLKFNVLKCQKMSIGHDIDIHYALKYGSSTREIEQVSEVRDLGIVVSDDLKWSRQCNQASHKAMAALGMIISEHLQNSVKRHSRCYTARM